MSEWINTRISKPPISLTVLLYICTFHFSIDSSTGKNKKYIVDDAIYTGFWGGDGKNCDYDIPGFYIETIDVKNGGIIFESLNETENLEIIAWTLLPRKPYKGIIDNE